MVNIQGIQVDVVGNIDFLLAEHAIFTIEFEYDSKLLICHTLTVTVKRTLAHILRKILGPKETNVALRQALLQSKYITVDIIKLNTHSLHDILENKYEMIENCVAYQPYGYNSLIYGLDSNERHYASVLIRKLMSVIDKKAKINLPASKSKDAILNRAKEVHAYDKMTGLYVRSFISIKEASEITGVCQSNISMCCKGHINTAGDYVWSYDKEQSVELPEDRRRKQPKATPSSDEISKRQKEFIQKNQNSHE